MRHAREMGYVRTVKIAKGLRVKVKVELAIVGGETLEKSTVEYIHGGGTMLPGIEAVLEGLEKGAKRDGVLKAKDAFGNPAMHPTKKMKRTEFPKDAKLTAGDKFTAKGANGGMDIVLQIDKVGDEEVDVKLVHPLADKDIKYAAEVVQVSDPKPPPMPTAALHLEEDKS
jgi:FKBP-type peptidyl-prolyl cis-trans isomerase 2